MHTIYYVTSDNYHKIKTLLKLSKLQGLQGGILYYDQMVIEKKHTKDTRFQKDMPMNQ